MEGRLSPDLFWDVPNREIDGIGGFVSEEGKLGLVS